MRHVDTSNCQCASQDSFPENRSELYALLLTIVSCCALWVYERRRRFIHFIFHLHFKGFICPPLYAVTGQGWWGGGGGGGGGVGGGGERGCGKKEKMAHCVASC